MCALNHYCAITRVDYREYKECFQTAASALASTASRPNLCCNNKNVRRQMSTTNSIITKEMLMYYFLIITALLAMQLEQLKQIVRSSCSVITYLTSSIIPKKCLEIVNAELTSTRNNAGISIKSTTTTTATTRTS